MYKIIESKKIFGSYYTKNLLNVYNWLHDDLLNKDSSNEDSSNKDSSKTDSSNKDSSKVRFIKS
jgi:hypothetical protein